MEWNDDEPFGQWACGTIRTCGKESGWWNRRREHPSRLARVITLL
jgi:hypothetical protein